MQCYLSIWLGSKERFNLRSYRPSANSMIGLTPLLLLGMLLGSGCALNDKGLVKVHRYENDTTYMVSLEVWGGHLIINDVDAGLTLGRSKHLYVYPKPQTGTPGSASGQIIIPSGTGQGIVAVNEQQNFPEWQALGNPVAMVTSVIGLAFSFSQFSFGIALGARSRGVIQLPQNFDGMLLLKYRSEHDGDAQIYITGGSQ